MDVVIASNPDHEGLFAEICFDDAYWARIVYDTEKRAFMLMIFPELVVNRQGEIILDLEMVQAALSKAKAALVERGYGAE